MIVAVPDVIPVTIPVADPMLIKPELLLQVPPVEADEYVDDVPVHTEDGPVIVAGNGLTVTECDELHPDTP